MAGLGMKVDILSRKTIKPSSPTPPHLRNFKLSFLDQIFPPLQGRTVFFYAADINQDTMDTSHGLQKSLSQTLTRFYPLAGRLKDAATIECNDEGAYFVEARVRCHLSDFLRQPDADLVDQLLPVDPKTTEVATAGCMLLIQFNIFDCGGTAIGVCPSHKLIDMSSQITFLQSWTAIARESGVEVVLPWPELIGGSLLPSRDFSFILPAVNTPTPRFITKRFVFDASSIAGLKDRVGGALLSLGQRGQPTRVQVVLALIFKCAMAAARSKSGSSLRQSLLFQTVNLRKRMVPPLPENSIGNLIWTHPVLVKESDIELHELVSKMKKGLTDFVNSKANKFKGDEGFVVICESFKEKGQLSGNGTESYRSTSLCRFPLYETDFGWGKPVWVSSASVQFGNTVVLVNTKRGDGIEAWVSLEEQEMAVFQRNQDLLAFASFNPAVLSRL
ncbi:hypothetical protein L1049_016871 [Liquidambar formosana]|uniref:Uncharacterized protein n=1 Tax=Liquidambar formosana TaxID=63359 RepID=A0AAP0X7T9_LIQFO